MVLIGCKEIHILQPLLQTLKKNGCEKPSQENGFKKDLAIDVTLSTLRSVG